LTDVKLAALNDIIMLAKLGCYVYDTISMSICLATHYEEGVFHSADNFSIPWVKQSVNQSSVYII